MRPACKQRRDLPASRRQLVQRLETRFIIGASVRRACVCGCVRVCASKRLRRRRVRDARGPFQGQIQTTGASRRRSSSFWARRTARGCSSNAEIKKGRVFMDVILLECPEFECSTEGSRNGSGPWGDSALSVPCSIVLVNIRSEGKEELEVLTRKQQRSRARLVFSPPPHARTR